MNKDLIDSESTLKEKSPVKTKKSMKKKSEAVQLNNLRIADVVRMID